MKNDQLPDQFDDVEAPRRSYWSGHVIGALVVVIVAAITIPIVVNLAPLGTRDPRSVQNSSAVSQPAETADQDQTRLSGIGS